MDKVVHQWNELKLLIFKSNRISNAFEILSLFQC
jgi:hypothetical protein